MAGERQHPLQLPGRGLLDEEPSFSNPSFSSSDEFAPTSSLDIRVVKAWTGFGQTSESEGEFFENKENSLAASNREENRTQEKWVIQPKENNGSLLAEMSNNQNQSDKDNEGSLRLFLEDTQGDLGDDKDSEDMFQDKDEDIQMSQEVENGDRFIVESSPLNQNSLNPSTSGGGVGALDESVIIVSPSPKKDPSYIDISDSFQGDDLKLELSQTQVESNHSPVTRPRDSQPLGVRDTQLLGGRDSHISEILATDNPFNTDIDQMIADDDDVQNMPNMIDLEDTQPSKEDSIDLGLFDQRLDFNVVMSPLKELRRPQVGASPLKFKTDFSVISPLKVKSDSGHSIITLRSEASKESVSADKPSSAIVRENNNQLNKNKLQTEGSPEPDHEPEPGGQALQADHPAVEALKADQPDVQAPLADQPDGQPRTESPDPSERLEGQSVTDGQDTGDRSEGQQLKRKAADALSSEDESRKKMDLKDPTSGSLYDKKSSFMNHTLSSPISQQHSLQATFHQGLADDEMSLSLDPARQMNGTDADTSPSKPDAAEVFTDGAPAKPEGGGRPRADTPQSSRPVSRMSSDRPYSRTEYSTPDISCSPIVGRMVGDGLESEGTSADNRAENNKQRKTSTPGNKILSSPQKILRKKFIDPNPVESSEDDIQPRQERPRPRRKQEEAEPKVESEEKTAEEDTKDHDQTQSPPHFKQPSPMRPVSAQAAFEFLIEQLRGAVPPENVVKWSNYIETVEQALDRPKPVKRLSDASSLSRSSSSGVGSGSGYLGGSSSSGLSSEGSKRSRLSINPGEIVEGHKVIAKLPTLLHSTLHPKEPSPDKQPPTDPPENEPAEHDEKEPTKLESISEEPSPGPSKIKSEKKPAKRPRNGSSASSSASDSRKRLVKKRNTRKSSEDDEEDLQDKVELEVKTTPSKPVSAGLTQFQDPLISDLSAGDRVYGRWTDPAGVYFYAAEILKIINASEVKVRFLEDKIERVLKVESELINVTALHPHDELTVKHDILEIYDVTAKLLSFPTRNAAGDVQYEVQITATDSEPQLNEDSRTVHYSDVSLTDNQASLIIRRLGFVPASNKVSADINFGNLIFGKRKPRTVNSSPGTTPSKIATGGLGSPAVTPKKTPRRKKGGSNIEDSAATMTESSAAETTTPRGKKKSLVLSTTEDERDNESLAKRSKKSSQGGLKAPALKPTDPDIFQGMCFILTQSKYSMPMTDQDDSEAESEAGERSKGLKFDKSKLRTAITQGGGRVLQDFPSQEDLADTVNEEVVTIADRMCLTMNYLLSLAHLVPVVSFMYIYDCVNAGRCLPYRPAYLLPAGTSSLLMMDVEQGQDCRRDLQINGCILPSPPATSTRLSNKSKEVEVSKKILSGLHVLVLTKDKGFADDWQSVLNSIGARVTKRTSEGSRLAQIRVPDVVVTDSTAPQALAEDLRKGGDIPVVSTSWAIQCIINNARVAYDNFTCSLPSA